MMTPFAGLPARTSTSAVTLKEWFFTLTTLFSDSRPMPGKNSCEFPLMSVGRPAISGTNRSAPRSSSGRTLYLVASIRNSRCSLCSISGISFARLRACVQSLLPSYSSQTSSSKATNFWPTVIQGVRCLVTALQPL